MDFSVDDKIIDLAAARGAARKISEDEQCSVAVFRCTNPRCSQFYHVRPWPDMNPQHPLLVFYCGVWTKPIWLAN